MPHPAPHPFETQRSESEHCAPDHSVAARHMVGLGCRSDWTPEAIRRRALEQHRTAEQPAWPWWAFA